MTSEFNIDAFEAMSDQALVNYCENVLSNRVRPLTSATELLLCKRMADYDEYHLVYSILLCSRWGSRQFLGTLPLFLAHTKSSVFCETLNALSELEPSHISDGLIQAIRRVKLAGNRVALVRNLESDVEGKKSIQ